MIADVEWKLGYTLPYIGKMALADVMPDHIDHLIDDLGQSLAQSTVRQIRNYLYQVFEAARERRYITYNPVIKPGRRKRAKQREPLRLGAGQALLLLRTAEATFYYLAWWLILTLGLRAGEICGLRWGDVDLDAGVIHIMQAVGDVRGTPTAGKPKNDKVRHLPIARALLPLFRAHHAAYVRRAAQGHKKGYWQEHGLVFPGRGGRPMNPTSLRHALQDLTDAAQLPAVTTHMLRHTAGKFYTDSGTPHEITQAILGHTPDITGHYAPPDPEAMRPWTERVYKLLTREAEQDRQEAQG